MPSDDRLKEIADDPWQYGSEPREMARELLALRWQPITAENLPRVGDEIMRWDGGINPTHVYAVFREPASYEHCMARGDTHFRPINPPAQTGSREEQP